MNTPKVEAMSRCVSLGFELKVQRIKIYFFGLWCNIYSIIHQTIKILSNKQTHGTNYNILFVCQIYKNF